MRPTEAADRANAFEFRAKDEAPARRAPKRHLEAKNFIGYERLLEEVLI